MTRSAFLLVCLICLGLSWSRHAAADPGSPVGLWKSFDDAGKTATALIRIVDDAGVLTGYVERLYLAPGDDPNPSCRKCEGARKNQPITGMRIMTNMRKERDGYGGGEILDPDSGDTYHCTLHVSPDGKRLDVRGYVGVPLLGRSQVWRRAE